MTARAEARRVRSLSLVALAAAGLLTTSAAWGAVGVAVADAVASPVSAAAASTTAAVRGATPQQTAGAASATAEVGKFVTKSAVVTPSNALAPLAASHPHPAARAVVPLQTAVTRDAQATTTSLGPQYFPRMPVGGKDAPSTYFRPTIAEDFRSWGQGVFSADGVWRIAGDWRGTGDNLLLRANAVVRNGLLSLTTPAGVMQGAEIQTMRHTGYGFYETRMKVSKVSGVCQSFFWIEGGGLAGADYGPGEIDVEFLTNEPWLSTARGAVHLTIHDGTAANGGRGVTIHLPFNPADGFHTYGFLWTHSKVSFVVDGKVVHSFTDLGPALTGWPQRGVIMANSWTGNRYWGGGPPDAAATAQYDWMRYYDGLSVIPPR